MTTELRQYFSASICNRDNLIAVKTMVFKEFDDDLKNIYPRGLMVIVDGTVFFIDKEEDYDKFARKLDEYFKVRNAKKKIITVSLFNK